MKEVDEQDVYKRQLVYCLTLINSNKGNYCQIASTFALKLLNEIKKLFYFNLTNNWACKGNTNIKYLLLLIDH